MLTPGQLLGAPLADGNARSQSWRCFAHLFNGPDAPVRTEARAAARPRPLLPSDLEASLQILSAAEFERLFTAVDGEASRRRKSEPTSARAHGPQPQKVNPPAGIPSGKANAV